MPRIFVAVPLLLLLLVAAAVQANKGGPDPNGLTLVNGRLFKGNLGYHEASQALAKGFWTWPTEFAIPINASTHCPMFNSKNLNWGNINEYEHLLKLFGTPSSQTWPAKLTRCLQSYCTLGNTDPVCHLHPYPQISAEVIANMQKELKRCASANKT